MTTEEKNALAKEYAEEECKMLDYQDDKDFCERNFIAGWDARDKEVSDLVEALRNLYNADPHDQTWNRSAAMDAANRLLSNYPVNTLPNG